VGPAVALVRLVKADAVHADELGVGALGQADVPGHAPVVTRLRSGHMRRNAHSVVQPVSSSRLRRKILVFRPSPQHRP
jgi:hypothetical protein